MTIVNNTVRLKGVVNEYNDFSYLKEVTGSYIEFNLLEVEHINSIGLRVWMDALEDLPPSMEIRLVGCSPQMVHYLSMLPALAARVQVKSFYAPYYCPDCDEEDTKLLLVSDLPKEQCIPEFICPSCQDPMEFDDDEDSYFYFLRQS